MTMGPEPRIKIFEMSFLLGMKNQSLVVGFPMSIADFPGCTYLGPRLSPSIAKNGTSFSFRYVLSRIASATLSASPGRATCRPVLVSKNWLSDLISPLPNGLISETPIPTQRETPHPIPTKHLRGPSNRGCSRRSPDQSPQPLPPLSPRFWRANPPPSHPRGFPQCDHDRC